jgi:hypothetical protein
MSPPTFAPLRHQASGFSLCSDGVDEADKLETAAQFEEEAKAAAQGQPEQPAGQREIRPEDLGMFFSEADLRRRLQMTEEELAKPFDLLAELGLEDDEDDIWKTTRSKR